ncbi:MAG: penicillin-binding protein activator [Methylovirgula sp.]|jgi:ABC-type branched-subunit amino acid transport system substrate-binding protein
MGNWGAFAARVFALAAAASLAGCLTGTNPSGNDDIVGGAPIDPVQSQALPPPDGSAPPGTTGAMPTQMGTGPVKVALILPLTQAGQPSNVGVSLRNAADLALSEAGTSDVTLLVKDDQSTPDGATAAAQSALTDGVDLIIGPLYAADVRAAEQVVSAAHKPMIAFSTDASTAEPGVYLLSFLVESYVDRIVDFAASKGKRSFAAMIPDNDYGRIAAAEFQQEAARRGVRVMEIENYDPDSMNDAAKKIAALGNQIDALFIPEQAGAMPDVVQALATNGVNAKKVQILGTGLWNDPRVLALPGLQGAWFAAPDNSGFTAFAARYRAKYSSDPARIATLSYDAVSLAVALAHRPGPDRFSDAILTNHAGFNGADGVFRFRSNGLNDRALAIMEINGNTAISLSPAPRVLAASAT